MKPALLSRLQRRALAVHLIACVLMLLAPIAMLYAVRGGFEPGIWAGLGAFIIANLLELFIS